MEPFGHCERNWTQEEKESIRKFLKYDPHVPLKIAETVFTAEIESAYFGKAGALAGAVLSGAFFFFPLVRLQPILRRLAITSLPGLYAYNWGKTAEEDIRWGAVFGAYQKEECSFLENNFLRCLKEKSVKDNVPKMTCKVENILWFLTECPTRAALYQNKDSLRNIYVDEKRKELLPKETVVKKK